MKKVTLSIKGMSCNHCKMRVEKTLKALDGVANVSVDLEAGRADVEYNPAGVSEDELIAAVSSAGYEVA